MLDFKKGEKYLCTYSRQSWFKEGESYDTKLIYSADLDAYKFTLINKTFENKNKKFKRVDKI